MLADELELLGLHLGGEARQPADDLGDALFAGDALGEEEAPVERAVGNRPGGQARVDLVDLLLIEGLEIVGRQLREVGWRKRKLVLDAARNPASTHSRDRRART